jgi:hypothetical protein
MNVALLRALVASVPAVLLLAGSAILFSRQRNFSCLLQLIGAACLAMVVLVHVAEALQVLSWMEWGHEHSAGHYLDWWSAVLGLTLFPTGYLFHTLTRR